MTSIVNIENPEEDIPNAPVDVETLITQKEQEVTNCREECNRLRQELSELKNLCPRGGECNWESHWYGSHGRKECTKCGKEEYEYSKGGGRKRKTRKRKGGFRIGQLVEIKWPNKDGSFNWWKARIIDDNGGPTIIVNWLGLFTPDGFPLHQEIKRPVPGYIRILSRGGRRTRRKQKGGHHLYKRLGVSKYASQKQIRKAFKTLKKKRKATKKVKEAYKILSRKKTRKQYNNRYRKMKRRK